MRWLVLVLLVILRPTVRLTHRNIGLLDLTIATDLQLIIVFEDGESVNKCAAANIIQTFCRSKHEVRCQEHTDKNLRSKDLMRK
jgi:hypothetical protein